MFDDLHDTDPPKPGMDALANVSRRAQVLRRRRATMIGGSGAAVIALIVAAVVVPSLGDDDRRIITGDTVSTTVPPTIETQPAPSTTDSIETTTPSTAVEPPTTPGVLECGTVERPPVYLVDGSPPGRSIPTTGSEGTTQVRWGTDDAQQVTQSFAVGTGLFDIASGPQAVARGDFRAAIVPTGDPPLGGIGISIADDSDGCVRTYFVGPGLELEEAIAYVTQWLAYLDIDRSISVQEAPDDQACTYAAGVLVACVGDRVGDNGEPLRPLADGRSDTVDPTIRVLQLLVEAGSDAGPLSGLARRVPVLGDELELIVDLIPQVQSCGRVTAPGGSSIGWSIGGQGEPTCSPPSSELETELPFVAIDGAGDAVLVESLDGTLTVLADGGDPDDPLPTEGEITRIDGVAVSPDRTVAMVSDCCEPIPGTLSRVDLATGAKEFVGYGRMPSFMAGGNLISEALGTISVGFVDGGQATVLEQIDPAAGTVIDLAVIDVDGMEFAVAIIVGPDGTSLLKRPAAGGDASLTVPISTATWTDEVEFSLAGSDSNAIYVLDETNGALMSFDPDSLSAIPVEQETNDWISAWIENDDFRYVDGQRRLFVNDVQVPGEYLWVR